MRIRPGRTRSLIGGVVALIVTAIGLVIMPSAGMPGGMGGMPGASDPFAIFRIAWVAIGLIGAGVSFYNAFSSKGVSLYEIDPRDDLHRSNPDEGSFCPKCGKPIGKDDRFCRNCGTYLRG